MTNAPKIAHSAIMPTESKTTGRMTDEVQGVFRQRRQHVRKRSIRRGQIPTACTCWPDGPKKIQVPSSHKGREEHGGDSKSPTQLLARWKATPTNPAKNHENNNPTHRRGVRCRDFNASLLRVASSPAAGVQVEGGIAANRTSETSNRRNQVGN